MQYSQYEGIHVGSGQHYAEGWLNTDILPTNAGKQPDVLADIFDYPTVFPGKQFKKAYVGHVLEHLPLEIAPKALAIIAETVIGGGEIMVVGPCINRAIATNQPESLIEGIKMSDDPEHPWAHSWTPTEELTYQVVVDAGLSNVEIIDVRTVRRPQWPNPSTAAWQTAIRATT